MRQPKRLQQAQPRSHSICSTKRSRKPARCRPPATISPRTPGHAGQACGGHIAMRERSPKATTRTRSKRLLSGHPSSCKRVDLLVGEFNESTQHLLILADEEVCEWRGMHGHGSRRNRRLSCGSAGRAVNVWRTSRERLRGGTRAASIGSWLAMEGLLQRHAGGLWERCGLRSAKRFREALPPVGRYGGSHRASNDRPQLSAERSGVTAAAAPTAPARLISAPGGGHCAQSLVAWRAMPSYDGASRRSSCSSGRLSRSLAG